MAQDETAEPAVAEPPPAGAEVAKLAAAEPGEAGDESAEPLVAGTALAEPSAAGPEVDVPDAAPDETADAVMVPPAAQASAPEALHEDAALVQPGFPPEPDALGGAGEQAGTEQPATPDGLAAADVRAPHDLAAGADLAAGRPRSRRPRGRTTSRQDDLAAGRPRGLFRTEAVTTQAFPVKTGEIRTGRTRTRRASRAARPPAHLRRRPTPGRRLSSWSGAGPAPGRPWWRGR